MSLRNGFFYGWQSAALCVLVSVALGAIAEDSRAQDAPDVGLLYNTKEVHSLSYRCKKGADSTLHCEFTQVSVRTKASPEDLRKRLTEGRKEFASYKNSPQECKSWQQVLDIMEGRAKPPKEPPREFSAKEREGYAELMRAFLKLCASPTEENFLSVIRLGHSRDMRTCKVVSNSYSQSFRPVFDGSSKRPAWVVAQDGAEGPCGLVNLSRFEAEKQEGHTFWSYTARKAITNPQGSFFGQSCRLFDESEYLYDWRNKEHFMDCDFIEFSVL